MNFSRSIDIAASPAEVFALTQDYNRRLEWDPFLESAELLDGATEAGVGVRALCVAKRSLLSRALLNRGLMNGGLAMKTEYVSFNPPRACAVKMTRGPKLIRHFAGSWRFEELSPGKTRVRFHYSLSAGPAWLAWLVTPIAGWRFGRDTGRRLAASKKFAEK